MQWRMMTLMGCLGVSNVAQAQWIYVLPTPVVPSVVAAPTAYYWVPTPIAATPPSVANQRIERYYFHGDPPAQPLSGAEANSARVVIREYYHLGPATLEKPKLELPPPTPEMIRDKEKPQNSQAQPTAPAPLAAHKTKPSTPPAVVLAKRPEINVDLP